MLALAALLLPACRHHTRGPDQLLKPEGETVTVEPAGGRRVTGELIVVEPGRIVLLSGGRFLAVPLEPLRTVEVLGYPGLDARHERRRLVLYARYPQGLRADQWALLLRERGQDAPDELAPRGRAAAPEPGAAGH